MKGLSIIGFLIFLVTLAVLPAAVEARHVSAEKNAKLRQENSRRELVLGDLNIGEPEAGARRKVGRLHAAGREGVYFNDHWSLWIDAEKKTVKGLSFEERGGTVGNRPYPHTGQGISLGISPAGVERVYGRPEQTLMGKVPFVLRTSELALIYVYPSQGLWIMFTNQEPFSGRVDWRVTLICIGEPEVIEGMSEASGAYAEPLTTKQTRQRVIAIYKKTFGRDTAKEPVIFDDYQYALQTALFEYVRKTGATAITPVMIIPRNKLKAKALMSDLSPEAPLFRELDRQAREKAALTHGISASDLDRIIGNIDRLKLVLSEEETDRKNAGAAHGRNQLAGSAP